MEIEKAKERIKELQDSLILTFKEDEELNDAIDIVLNELDNKISKNDLLRVLRRVQDYQLNYKDTVLFNIIMQEIFGETEWINLEDKE